jgi:hypothetical protein
MPAAGGLCWRSQRYTGSTEELRLGINDVEAGAVKRAVIGAILLWCAAVVHGQTGAAQPGAGPRGLAAGEKVELKGTIERVQITPGQGTPFLEVKDEKGTVKVYLGSMRYLLEQNFSPKAGSKVVVKGFKSETGIVARTVEMPAEKQSIELRSEDGMPLWRMGGRGAGKK